MGPGRMSMRMLLLAFVGTLALLSLGSYIERYANSGTSTLVTVAGLQSHEERVQDRLNSLEGRLAKVVEDSQTKGGNKLGAFIRKELAAIKAVIRQEVKQSAATLAASATAAKPNAAPASCPRVCLDVAILYHEDDKPMFVDNGVLQSIQKHIQGVRRIHVISASDRTFQHLMDSRTTWFDEARVPIRPTDWEGRKSGRPLGWLYQQTLKYWAAQFLPDACPNLMFIDSDTVFLRDFNPVSYETHADGTCRVRFKYNLSTQDSGAWYGDIENPEYHHFVEFMTGMPKALKMYATAINHWQIMQRDVMQAMARSIRARKGFANTTAAMVHYGLNYNGMSEYEAYFTFAWYFYQDRLAMVNVPFVMRDPKQCSYFNNETTLPFKQKTIVTYFTCHDTYSGEDYYTNCKGREDKCDPRLASR